MAIFLRETQAFGVTPVHFAALQTVASQPCIDQRPLARTVGLDTSTITGVIDRLESRGLLVRSASPEDRRVRHVTPTREGIALLDAVLPSMFRSQRLLLAPLTGPEQAEFMRLVKILVNTDPDLSRVPTDSR